MQLLVIRHAPAEDRDTFAESGQSDDQRPLTPEGRRKMRQGVSGLREAVPAIDLLASSPLVRARQTAEIVAKGFGGLPIVEWSELAPGGGPQALLRRLETVRTQAVVAIVGHEPDLGIAVSWLLAGRESSSLELKKGAACLLDFPGALASGSAVLLWAMPPAILRQLGE